MTSEGVHSSSFQYLSSISESQQAAVVPTFEDTSRKDVVVVGSLSNNNNNNFVVIKPEESVFESYPEIGLRQQEELSQGRVDSEDDGDGGGKSSDVNNPLFSINPAFTRGTSLPEVILSQSQLINNNNTIISTNKITSNHLSVKLHREGTAPYSTTLHQQHKHLFQSRTVEDDSFPRSGSLTGEGEDMYDSVMVSSAPIHVNKSSGLNGDILVPTTNHIHHHHLQNNPSSKLEPNGNNIEIQLQSAQLQLHEPDLMMRLAGQQRVNNGSSYGGPGPGSDSSVILGLLHGNNSSVVLGPGGSVMSHGNGGGVLTSPGGSLEDQDCDEEKVINGDTFTPGDVPDPDAIKMFVGQIPKHLSESELKTLFEEFGRVFQINVLRDKVSKQSKGCCFVTFYTRKAALDAQNALHNVKTLSGMNHPIQMKPADNENRYERKLFVGMLSKKCSESDVRNMFSRFGHIDECTVLRDPQGTSRGCAFITFASKQCATSAIKALHHSLTMEGCSSPVVVKFADTQKDKDQKRNQQIHTSFLPGFQSPPASVNTLSPQYFTLLQQLQQQQQQNNSYFSSLSPLSGIATLASLTSPSPGASLTGLTGSHGGGANSDLAALAALANFTGVGVTSSQHSVALGIQAAIAAALNGTHSSLSQDYGYSTVNGSSLGSSNSIANSFTGNGLQSSPGLSSYTSALRSSAAASKQAEGPDGANLFIYHLPPEATDPDLISMFSPFGTVISAKVYIDKNTNRSKCFGFVSYDNAMSAQVAIQTMNGFQVGMKRLKVQLKRSKEAAKPY